MATYNELLSLGREFGITPTKPIRPVDLIPQYQESRLGDDYKMFYCESEEDFIKALWWMVVTNDIRHGFGSWQQDNGQRIADFFSFMWKNYFKGSKFTHEDRYIMQVVSREAEASNGDTFSYPDHIYVTSLYDIKKNYRDFMSQFADDAWQTGVDFRLKGR